MKLKKIIIKELFGLEDNNFDIDLYPDTNISLLYGFNGIGKTSIIKLVYAMLSNNTDKFDKIGASSAKIIFDNATYLKKQQNSITYYLDYNLVDANTDDLKNRKEISNDPIKAPCANPKFDLHFISSNMPDLKKEDINDFIFYCKVQLNISDNINEFFEKAADRFKYFKFHTLLKKLNFKKLSKEDIQLFENIINEKLGLTSKDIKIDEDNETIVFVDAQNNKAEAMSAKLSEGEINILCLFIELIFFSRKNSIFFIDKPETSLHVCWQGEIVNCINEICKKRDMQVIITTHSPDIIGNNEKIATSLISERLKNESDNSEYE